MTKESKISKIEIVTGFSCNNNCRFCSVGNRNFDKNTYQMKQDIRKAAETTRKEINFTGGEPTIRKDIFELIEYARSFGFEEIRVTTNGRMFSYEDFTKKIVFSGLTGAIFSIHAHTAKLHDYFTCVSGSFDQAIEGWKNLKNNGGLIDNNVVITTKNYRFLPELAEMLIKNDVRGVCLIYPTIDGNLLKNLELVPAMNEAAPFIHKAIDIIDQNQKTAWCLNMPVCFMSGYEKYSELMELRTKMIWPNLETNLDEKRKEGRFHVNVCSECKFRMVCAGVPKKYLDLKGDKNIMPVKGDLIRNAIEIYK